MKYWYYSYYSYFREEEVETNREEFFEYEELRLLSRLWVCFLFFSTCGTKDFLYYMLPKLVTGTLT